jgi:hypothetical protein
MRPFRRPRPDEAPTLPEGMIPTAELARRSRGAPAQAAAGEERGDPELRAKRDRLLERFMLMQAELGGLYYEMAIRDSVREDVLRRRAAELQRVDIELAQVDRLLQVEDPGPAGTCPSCGAAHGRADLFCSQCAQPLRATVNGTARS